MKVELLAPAGSMEAVHTALYFGADAVYAGGPMLQLRAGSAGFSFEELHKAAKEVHQQGKKLYVTVNCFADNREIAAVPAYARELLQCGADAAIVSDLGVVAALRESVPELPVHISTQANTVNYKAAELWHRLGAARVVLGREMQLEDIRYLREHTPPTLEIEAFVHGAMCMAYSGRCLISSYLSNRSGNRGDCTQPCRWNYFLVEEKRPGMLLPVCEEEGATAILSSNDLNCITFLQELERAGISSFKIEGRMKSPYYVATVVNAYRHAMDGTAPLTLCEQELDCASHRPYNTGFYFGAVAKEPNNDGLYRADCVFTGMVLESTPNGALVEMRNRFAVGDTLEILSPASLGNSFTVTGILGADGLPKEQATLVQERVLVQGCASLHAGDILRRRAAVSP